MAPLPENGPLGPRNGACVLQAHAAIFRIFRDLINGLTSWGGHGINYEFAYHLAEKADKEARLRDGGIVEARTREFALPGFKTACSICSQRDLCLPRGLGDSGLSRLERLVESLGPLHKGDHLFRKGDIFRAIYAVRSGYIKTYVDNEAGEEHVLGFHMAGELLGLDSIGAGHKQCSAEVLDTAIVCRLPFIELTRLCCDAPELQRQLLRLMSRDLMTSHALAAEHSVESRLAAFLLGWGERLAQRGFSRRHFMLPMSREDIGSYLRLAPETVSRTIAHFRERCWITVSRREIWLTDEAALGRLCQDDWRA